MDKNKILELRKQNKNSKEISEILNIPKIDVDLFLIEYYYDKRSKLSIDQWKQVIFERSNNKSFTEICKNFGLSDSTISQRFKKYGIYFFPYNYFNYNEWSQEKIKNLINDFESGIPIYQLVTTYGFSKYALAKIINTNGGNTTSCSFNNLIFDDINTEEKAYWLGFLYADGAVSSSSNDCELSLQLLDAYHLYKFKQFIKAKSKIKLDFKGGRCRLSIGNKHFHTRLTELGCTSRKSLTLTFPNINIFSSKELVTSFIRGYFDGDGCLSHHYCDTKKQRFTIQCGFIGTFEFLTVLKNILAENNILCNFYKDKRSKNNTFELLFNKTNSIKLLNYLYDNANIYLERKYQQYLFFAKHDNFAVYISDYIDNKRAISEKAKLWINNYFNIDYETEHANAEIIKNIKCS